MLDAIAAQILAEAASIEEIRGIEPGNSRSRSIHLNATKDEIRTSLKASTLDGVFATLFTNVTGGVLLTNFLLELGATATEIGILSSIPMLANLMQPIGAYWSEQTNSRHNYCFWIYGLSRSLWVLLAIAIFWVGQRHAEPDLLIAIVLGVATFSYFLGALGSAPWLSWMAALVPPPLRGRYFGLRSSAANLTNLISVPLIGFGVSRWQGGSIQGYGIVLILGVVAGLVSLGFQNFMMDVNPQTGQRCSLPALESDSSPGQPTHPLTSPLTHQALFQPISPTYFWQDSNFLKFLVYFNLGLWIK